MPEKGEFKLNLTDVDYKNIRTWSGIGLTQGQMAGCLGCHVRTFEDEIARNPKLKQTIEEGKANAIAYVTSKLWKLIEDNDKASIFFYLKCRGGWRETVNVETKGTGKFTFVKSNERNKV